VFEYKNGTMSDCKTLGKRSANNETPPVKRFSIRQAVQTQESNLEAKRRKTEEPVADKKEEKLKDKPKESHKKLSPEEKIQRAKKRRQEREAAKKAMREQES